MGLLNVLKGAYPSLQQIDKSLLVATGETGIVRGSLIYVDGATNTFKLAGTSQQGSDTTPGDFIYIALMDQSDLVAGMAGTVGQGIGGGVAKITGLACSMPMEIETDQYDQTLSPTVGQFLMVGASGKFVLHTDGKTCIGQVTHGVVTRWANDAIAVTGWRLGNKVNTICLRTMYLPGLQTA